ncbi:hypothetical protein [Glycomyces salinus]|uniref:hypothetical protein n=1 Tax=Glycomyces salinus TaxID=980294 RepID=UPI0018EA895C|nr:hypothetical protein [Glycomyces salinus]
MPIHRFTEGEIVKARPNFLAPRDPSSTRPFAWPFYYPARIASLFGDDGAIVEFLEHQHSPDAWDTVITPWSREQGFSVKELHALDCDCGACDPDEVLRDPRERIDQLQKALTGLGQRRAEHTERALRDHRFPGRLQITAAADLAQGDFLLFPQQHLHRVQKARGETRLTDCSGTIVVGAATRYLVFRPDRPAPVCDPDRAFFDRRYTSTTDGSGLTELEHAVTVCLTDLGLTNTEPDEPSKADRAVAGRG